ncbi:uncharacterized protein CC84DRAFT_536933 [Paraphaeosphaeria sporulosa]|uniref:Uncharacterized protein n=1 Tax=Paraphaeosphaeria sporulosa TaxID=1460663 RepID=A0A177CMV2_9PLEO|nr:uncharacterized protein CC84DRAFT_536933 [Paraphaeosphaeria sporulosa]OAG08097.1 hypothetical protein CC84DRAFT_536933 [Paraphaeosphaeria sporulosa]
MKHRQEKSVLDNTKTPALSACRAIPALGQLAPLLPITYYTPAPASPAKQAFGMPTNPMAHHAVAHAVAYSAVLAHHHGCTTAEDDSSVYRPGGSRPHCEALALYARCLYPGAYDSGSVPGSWVGSSRTLCAALAAGSWEELVRRPMRGVRR